MLLLGIGILLGCESDFNDDVTGSDGRSSELYLSDGTGAVGPGPGTGSGDTTQQVPAGVITAGEWNDLRNWDFWYQLVEEDTFGYAMEYWGIYPLRNRYSLKVENLSGQPVVDLPVTLKSNNTTLWAAKTDNKGQAEFWTEAFSDMHQQSLSELKFFIDDAPVNQEVKSIDEGVNIITYQKTTQRPKNLDVVFVVDATGSMGDELEYLKAEVLDVIQKVKANNSPLVVRTGSVFYRDEGDEYVTKVSQITGTIQTTVNFIKNQKADGGGDFPEAVHSALADAVQQLSWSDEAVARVMFLILDAPPHYDPSVVNSIKKDIEKAALKGIKIVPVSASGIDKGTEFLLRFMAALTNSTYTFITDHSGIGNEHLTPTVGEYEVEYLNDLMVRLINEYVE